VGIPVFPSRSFRHNGIYLSPAAEVQRPEDLAGKRVGLAEYQMTAALWVRAFLAHDYGVTPDRVHWLYGALNIPTYEERLEHAPPDGVRIERIPDSLTLEGM